MFLSITEYLPSTRLEIVAAVLSTIAVGLFIISAIFKRKNEVLLSQSIAHIFLIFSECVSGAWSSVVQDAISIIRNITIYFKKNTKIVNIVLIVTATVVGIYANLFTTNFFTPWKGLNFSKWYCYLPVIANLEYSVVLLQRNIKLKWIKLSFGISSLLWGTQFVLMGKALLISGILNIITGIVSLVAFVSLCVKKEEQI